MNSLTVWICCRCECLFHARSDSFEKHFLEAIYACGVPHIGASDRTAVASVAYLLALRQNRSAESYYCINLGF